MKPDAVIRVRFKRTDEGGRQGPVVRETYHCMFIVDGVTFDCRLYPQGRTLELGVEYEVPVRFLSPDLVVPRLAPGRLITLREGKEVASGQIVSVTAIE